MAVGLIAASLLIIAAILANSFIKIRRSEQVALEALASLKEKNEYIAATARQVAPDYLELTDRAERAFEFQEAEQSLDTGLAFDASLAQGWLMKGKMLLAQQRFPEAWEIFSGAHDHPVEPDPAAFRLARKYKDADPVSDAELPQLVRDFINHGMTAAIPRLFYHLNRTDFDPDTRFPAISESLRLLNPDTGGVDLKWQQMAGSGWLLDLGTHPELNNIAPLCGLQILILNASNTGAIDTRLLTEEGMLELRLSGARLNRLPELASAADLQVLDISNTRIRNIDRILQYPSLRSLDISGINDLVVSPQLVWSQRLQMLTVAADLFNDPTVIALSRRGVVINYADE
jgi:tetratricopeptide (TPR) repeat protein